MPANRTMYGIRWHSSLNGANVPGTFLARIASGYQAAVNGVTDTSLGLRKGDPIRRLATGYWELADGNEGAGGGEVIDGIILGIEQYWDGEKIIRAGTRVPYGTTYSGEARETRVRYIPVQGNRFEIDCDDAATATTRAAYLAFVGELCDHRLKTGGETDGKAWPKLDISTHGTASGQWKIDDISGSMNNRDFSGANVKLIVSINEPGVAI